MNPELAWPIVVPLLGAVGCVLSGPKASRWIAGLTAMAGLAAAIGVSWSVATRGPLLHFVGGWGAPLGINLEADGLTALLLLAVGVITALLSLAALTWSEASRPEAHFLSLWLFAWAALAALLLSADLFNLYVTLELLTLASVALLAIDGQPEALRAGLRYLLIALPGSLLYLLGVALLYGTLQTLDLAMLGTRLGASPWSWTALGLMTAGLAMKSALFPLHGWLPAAYVGARAPVSGLLSALLGKGAFFVLLKLWLSIFPTQRELYLGHLLGALGAAAILWGSLLALSQRRLKTLIAYSSIAQLGYLFLVFPLGAWSGGAYLALSHAAASGSMFLAAGTIHRTMGHDELAGLDGLAHHLPVTYFALALSGVSLMGMPPSGGFVAKWLLLRAAMERGQWWLAIPILLGGLLAAAYVARILRGAFLPAPESTHRRPLPPGAELLTLTLALLAVLLGLSPSLPLWLLAVGAPP